MDNYFTFSQKNIATRFTSLRQFVIILYMVRILKKVWILLIAVTIFGLLSMVPLDKWQKVYLDEFHRLKARPQQRVDSSYKYVEYLENGGTPNKEQIVPTTEDVDSKPAEKNTIRKPYFIRDKNNPKILYPYRG